jgi:hypothetical protein
MEKFAFLNSLKHRLNKHKILFRTDLAKGVYKFGDSIFVFQKTVTCAKSLDLYSIANETFCELIEMLRRETNKIKDTI